MKISISPLQERDACLALVLLVLIVWFFWRHNIMVYIAMAALAAGMVWPACMKPFAVCWFGLSTGMGAIMSRVLLGFVWLSMVVPVGFIRKLMGKDSMRLKNWHQNNDSVFIERNHKYTDKDLNNPY